MLSNRIPYFIIPIFLFIFFFLSCNKENYLIQINQTTDVEGWEYKDSLDFEFDIRDTSLLYSILLDIDHTTDYPYQNIYFRISTTFPSGKRLKQELSSDLADKLGAWYGKCSGKDCLAAINLQQRAKFSEIGKHTISIAQYSRDSALIGIKGLDLKLADFSSLNQQ